MLLFSLSMPRFPVPSPQLMTHMHAFIKNDLVRRMTNVKKAAAV